MLAVIETIIDWKSDKDVGIIVGGNRYPYWISWPDITGAFNHFDTPVFEIEGE